MVGLDNLAVVTALATIQDDLQAWVEQLSWTVNAYVLGVGVLMLTGAALGDRLGRRRMFIVGLLVFRARAGPDRGGACHPARSRPRSLPFGCRRLARGL
jgi:MFS family permease